MSCAINQWVRCVLENHGEMMSPKLLGIMLWTISICTCDGVFVSEPSNFTVVEGESMKWNCSMAVISEDIATWVINGLEYYWSDFSKIEVYTFDLRDNSLTIHNSPRSLDGNSYQCIVDNRRSQVGYLRVLYIMSPTPGPSTVTNSSLTESDATVLLHPSDSSPSLPVLPLMTSTAEATTSTLYHSVIVIASVTVGTMAFCFGVVLTVACTIILLVLCQLRQLYRSKCDKQSTASPDDEFRSDQNNVIQTQPIKAIRSTLYQPTYHFPLSP